MTLPPSIIPATPPALTLAAFDTQRLIVGGVLTLFIVVCVLLVLTILIQKPQGGGLSGAFGAGASGSGQTAFGTKTGDALTWMTIAMFVIYLATAIGMNYTMRPPGNAQLPSAGAAPAPAGAKPGDAPAQPPGSPDKPQGDNKPPTQGATPAAPK